MLHYECQYNLSAGKILTNGIKLTCSSLILCLKQLIFNLINCSKEDPKNSMSEDFNKKS